MYQQVRAEQRAATESAMVEDNDLGAELQEIKLALDRLNAEPDSPEEKSAATL